MPTAQRPRGRPDITGVILAGGRGERLGGRPKAFLVHRGVSLLEHAVVALGPHVGAIVAGLPPDMLERARALIGTAPGVVCVAGGATRQATASAALEASAGEIVLLHEVARPFASPALFGRVLEALGPGVDGVVPVTAPVWRDAAVTVEAGRLTGVHERQSLRLAQTPQAYRRGPLAAALARSLAEGRDEPTCFAPLLRAGATLAAVEGEPANLGITDREDLRLLERA